MITTKRKSFLLVLSLLLVLSACGGGDDSTTEEVVETAGEEESLDSPATTAAAAEPEVEKLKVGLVVGALGDRSFMDSAKRGFDQAVAELPIEGDFIEAEEAERAQAYANFIADGKDLIIGISFSEAGRILEAATANPDIQFAIVDMVVTDDGGNLLPNVANIVFKEHEGSFEVGYIAGKLSKTGQVAFMGGMDVPIIRKFQTGWEEGARYANPDIEFCTGYAGSWGDPAKGKEIGLSCFEGGADIIFAAGGATGDGAYEAAAETGNFAIGVDSNQDYIQPGTMITSMMKGVDKSVYRVIEQSIAADGAVFSSIDSYGLAENFVGATWIVDETNLFSETGPADLTSQIPGLLEEVRKVREQIISGEIVVTDVTAGG
jgi:basic membrane protein A|tara:strand:+ start:4036 stop:5163 length:1128 start_codon:yes stop_codon:yes gene_type:complete